MFLHILLSLLRCYGGGHSLNEWQRDRLASSFESKNTARKRKAQLLQNDENQNPPKKKKEHTGKFNTMVWDKEKLKSEIKELPDGHVINYSELSRRFNVCDSSGKIALNGGQIVKEYLISKGVDLTRFQMCVKKDHDKPEVIRRRKRKGKGGEISVPTEITRKKLKEKLREKVHSGEYTVGEMIVPCKVYVQIVTYINMQLHDPVHNYILTTDSNYNRQKLNNTCTKSCNQKLQYYLQ